MPRSLPSSLNRKAIISTFDRCSAVSWEKHFEREAMNGLKAIRVDGDYPGKAYYDTERLILWLIRNGHYNIIEIRELIEGPQYNPVRTHVMAG